MRDSHDKPADPAAPKKKSATKRTKNRNGTEAVRVEGGKFKKGHSGNPAGGPKQIFHTCKPWKQALMRQFRDLSDASGQDELQQTAGELINAARKGGIGALIEIGNRLDGSPEKEPAAPQQNTLQLVMNSIRVLNLTAEQRDEFAKQLTLTASSGDGSSERTGGIGGATRD